MRTAIRILFHPIKYIKFLYLDNKKDLTISELIEHGSLYDFFFKRW